jgi:hypothetical protein
LAGVEGVFDAVGARLFETVDVGFEVALAVGVGLCATPEAVPVAEAEAPTVVHGSVGPALGEAVSVPLADAVAPSPGSEAWSVGVSPADAVAPSPDPSVAVAVAVPVVLGVPVPVVPVPEGDADAVEQFAGGAVGVVDSAAAGNESSVPYAREPSPKEKATTAATRRPRLKAGAAAPEVS